MSPHTKASKKAQGTAAAAAVTPVVSGSSSTIFSLNESPIPPDVDFIPTGVRTSYTSTDTSNSQGYTFTTGDQSTFTFSTPVAAKKESKNCDKCTLLKRRQANMARKLSRLQRRYKALEDKFAVSNKINIKYSCKAIGISL